MRPEQIEVGAEYRCRLERGVVRVRVDSAAAAGGWMVTDVEAGQPEHVRRHEQFRERWNPPATPASDAPPDDVDERIAAAPPSVVPYDQRRARAKAVAAADQHNARLRDERAAAPDGMTASERAMAERAVTYDPDRCATPRCKREPAMTYLGKRLCQACWEVATRETTSDGAESAAKEITMSKKNANKKTTKAPKASKATKTATTKKSAAQPKAERKPAADAKPKRVSALDAAAEVLRKAGKPMRSQEMITAMAEQGLWSSPNGKTPHATLYAAILREINDKGGEARFRKADRGLFEYAG